ncbi:MAG: response regulator [Mucilaginibacter sp.]|nr:response regulator [Mucilaginibacter sp.]
MDSLSTKKILFVLDHDVIFHRILTFANKKSNYKGIYFYTQATHLLSYLKEHRSDTANLPDVLFLDIPPSNDGWLFLDAYDELRTGMSKNIAVYIVSASVRQYDKQRALSYGFVLDYILKPLPMDKFREIAGVSTQA